MAKSTGQLQKWGANSEFGPYRVQGDGLPYFSDVFKDFLEQNNLSVAQFAHLYGELTKNNSTPYTKGRIYQMIRDNSFPTDPKRRWILAKLLSIPPVLLGLNSLDELLAQEQEKATAMQTATSSGRRSKQLFSVEEYHQALESYWKLHKISTLHEAVSDIHRRIRNLEREVLYGDQQTKEQSVPLLCGYHMLLANMKTDREQYDLAVAHLNKAYAVAKEKKLDRLVTTILLRRGWAIMARGEKHAYRPDSEAVPGDFSLASHDYQAALDISRVSHPSFTGVITVSLGLVEAKTAQTPQDFATAMRKLDVEEKLIGKTYDEEDIHFVHTDEEQYHLDRAEAYLAAPVKTVNYPEDARRELRNALAAIEPPYPKRHQAFNLGLQAQSYLIGGEYEQAVKHAKEGLVIASEIGSSMNIARITVLYEAIDATSYGKKNSDVAMLGIELAKTRYPDIFS